MNIVYKGKLLDISDKNIKEYSGLFTRLKKNTSAHGDTRINGFMFKDFANQTYGNIQYNPDLFLCLQRALKDNSIISDFARQSKTFVFKISCDFAHVFLYDNAFNGNDINSNPNKKALQYLQVVFYYLAISKINIDSMFCPTITLQEYENVESKDILGIEELAGFPR